MADSISSSKTIVTLTTDLGDSDYYVALLKGALLRKTENLLIVDITHQIKPFDIIRAAFVVKNVFREFPEGTVHLVNVNAFASGEPRFLALHKEGHFFIGPDNGLFSLVFDEHLADVRQLPKAIQNGSFHEKEILSSAVAHLCNRLPFESLGTPCPQIERRLHLRPVVLPGEIRGTVIHIDHYGNVVTNISLELFRSIREGRPFALYFKRNEPLTRISATYSEVEVGEPLCLFNSSGLLEIAIHLGDAAGLFDIHLDDSIQLEFH